MLTCYVKRIYYQDVQSSFCTIKHITHCLYGRIVLYSFLNQTKNHVCSTTLQFRFLTRPQKAVLNEKFTSGYGRVWLTVSNCAKICLISFFFWLKYFVSLLNKWWKKAVNRYFLSFFASFFLSFFFLISLSFLCKPRYW